MISFSYYKVWLALARRSLPGRIRVREEVEICRKKRTNRMLIAMVVIFAICWLPLNIVHMVSEFHRSDIQHFKFLFLTTHVIAMSSTVYNPFLYAWLNDNFRKEFQQILPCLFKICWCLQRPQRSSNITQSTNNFDGDYYNDRPSTYQLPVESTIATFTQQYSQMRNSLSNGRLNGSSMKQQSHRSSQTQEFTHSSPTDETNIAFLAGQHQESSSIPSNSL